MGAGEVNRIEYGRIAGAFVAELSFALFGEKIINLIRDRIDVTRFGFGGGGDERLNGGNAEAVDGSILGGGLEEFSTLGAVGSGN